MTKKNVLFFLIGLLCFHSLQSQTTFFNKYAVYFTDKNLNPFSINNPSAFLTQKAIERRNNFGIAIDEKDIPVTPLYVFGISQTGVTILNASKWLNCVTIQTSDSMALVNIRNMVYVDRVIPVSQYTPPQANGIYSGTLQSFTTSVNPLDYGLSSNQIKMLHADYLHQKNYTGQGMTIALIDAGFLNADSLQMFDSIRNNHQILGTYDFVERNDSVYEDNAHGSMVLSTIAANMPGYMVGTCPSAKFWLLRSEDGDTENPIEEYNWVSAAEFADSVGADVISCSLGYSEFDTSFFNHTYADMDGNTTPCSIGADIAASRGMLIVNSAGNAGDDPWFHITAPSDADSILCIGAVDSLGIITAFSSRGYSSDGDVKPNVCAQGGLSTIVEPYTGTIVRGSGTSFSCPILAGCAACLWQANPTKNFFEIKQAIEFSASFYSNPNINYGYGIPDFQLADLYLKGELPDQFSSFTLPLVYPNPFTNSLQLIVYSDSAKNISINLYDVLGRLIEQFTETVIDGYNKVYLKNLDQLPNGIYVLETKGAEEQTFRLVKQ